VRDRILAGLPEAFAIAEKTLAHFKSILDRFLDEITHFGSAPTLYASLVNEAGDLEWYDGRLLFRQPDG
jgi:hypothetical protein